MAFLAAYDVLLTPALAERPLPHRRRSTRRRRTRWTTFTPLGRASRRSRAIFNVTGQPAISLPLFEGEDGLPLGVQLVGRPPGEGALLALAAQLEAARPWAERRPAMATAMAD